jgi:hypothetical protein
MREELQRLLDRFDLERGVVSRFMRPRWCRIIL